MKTKKEIFRDVLMSAQTGCVLKIKIKGQKNPVITAVDLVVSKKIILKRTCLYGFRIENRIVTLSEIENVTRYETRFDHPLFEKVRFIKNNLRQIRKNLGMVSGHPSALAQGGGNF